MSDQTFNEYLVLIQGKTNIEDAVVGKDVVLEVHATIRKIEDEDNDDGTFNRIYKMKPTSIIVKK